MSIVLNKFTDDYFASCPKGLEEVLSQELKSLGAKDLTLASRGVHFSIKKNEIGKVILYSRVTSSLYLKLFDFDVTKEKDIYTGIHSIDWPSFFSNDQTFKFQFSHGVSPKLKRKSQFHNLKYLSFVAKDGYVDRFKLANQSRPNVDLEFPQVMINCHVMPFDAPGSNKEKVTVLLDLIGSPLCHRGYRSEKQKAPVRENLAAGILDLVKWDSENENFIDLTCGSGTFIFEALIKKHNLPARFKNMRTLNRNINKELWNCQQYHFLKDITHNSDFSELIKESSEKYDAFLAMDPKIKFIGNDFHSYVLKELRESSESLRWQKHFKITNLKAEHFNQNEERQNLLFTNPPYGIRVGRDEEMMKDLYYEMGENFKNNYKNSRWAIMSPNNDWLKTIHLKPSTKNLVSHGSLDCKVLTFEQLKPRVDKSN